jgi:hypothetical protein
MHLYAQKIIFIVLPNYLHLILIGFALKKELNPFHQWNQADMNLLFKLKI